jgi:hypothetical protein
MQLTLSERISADKSIPLLGITVKRIKNKANPEG